MALFVTGANVTTEQIQQTQFKTTYDVQESVIKHLEGRNVPYKIKILHITPDLYPKFMEGEKYHIGRLVWETDKLPNDWIEPCNKMNEIWTTTEAHAEVMRKSDITVPIYCFPEPIMVQEANERITPFVTKYKKDFTFYSIFQWIDRKNPRGLLRAYWKAFEGREDVTLLLKTYRNTYDESEFQLIERNIEEWKGEMNIKKFPKIFLVKKLLKNSDMKKLHMMGNCYVNPSSGEGWCRPMAEAMLYGRPVISGSNGGVTDLVSFYYKVPSKPESITPQSWIPWYTADQTWKVLNEEKLILAMKNVIGNYNKAKDIAKKAQDTVIENFSLQVVGRQMLERLSKIQEKL
jgi:glycosyltransferase involved in cell wall biosynthesis